MSNRNPSPQLILILISFILFSCSQDQKNKEKDLEVKKPVATSLLGNPLFIWEPSGKLLDRYQKHKDTFDADPKNADNIIWFGRFTAYKGDYNGAIDIYTNGIKLYPDDARFYRHRGHRYITIRKFNLAIQDFEKAAKLIEGKPNEIEPDGMPNAKNIPISSLHGNIWYHLGLAYYLKNDMENALRSYKNCLASLKNNDNLVSSTHWLYMILNRLGKKEEANKYLAPINKELEIIENLSYHNICLFYKGEITESELLGNEGEKSANDAIKYAVGNWYYYNGNKEKAGKLFNELIKNNSWYSFGYIAAEAEVAREFRN